MEADGGEWELSKENIQPLKHGRAMSSLQAALDPHCQEDLRQKRREFEEELRTSSGVTLLDVYHRYVLWVEQHHVTGGHGVNLKQLLEQAIMQFKTNRELYNDERYVGIWMRYALQSPEPLTLFKAMYEMQVGVQQAQFFATWAQHLEASGDTRGASRVLRKGIDLRATPTCLLEGALRHLEARTSRQVALDVQQQQCQESAFVGGQQDARSVLAPLRPQGKQGTAPLIRTGRAARPAEQQPGGLAIVTTGSTAGNRGHTKVRVQADENAPPDALLVQPVAAPPFVTTAQLTKENSRAAGKWSGVTVKQHAPSASMQQSFDVLEEQSSQPAPCTPALVPGSRQALSERKKTERFNDFSCWDSWEVPLCKPDPPDLLVRPMYDKASVYRGTTEFQFEEIRMANIRARQRQRLERQLELERDRRLQRELEQLVHQEREQSKRDNQVEALKREVQQLHEELEKLRCLLAKSRTGTREHAVMTSQVVHLEQSILVAERSILGRPVLGGGLVDEEASAQPEEVGVPPGTPSVHQASGSASAENTQCGGALRTPDMSKVVRSLWNCTLAQSGLATPSLSQQDRTLEAAPSALMHDKAEDEGPTETALDGVAVAVGAAPFEVFREPTQTGGLPCIAQPAPVHVPMEGDNDENRPPTNCCQPEPSVRTRPLERRVPFAELPMQDDQAVDNNDDDDDVCQGIEPLEDEDNFTYAPSKSFVRKVTSTPCAVDYTVPAVGEGFTVGGLTALVQEVTIGDPCPSTPMTQFAPPCPAEHCPKPSQAQQQEPCLVEPQLLSHPAQQPAAESMPGPDAGNTVPLAKRRFSVAAAGDLSTILECSKEGKSSSNSGGSSCSSSSSQHLPGAATLSSLARPPTGGTSNLPVLQEEPDGHGDASTTTPAAPVPEQLQEQSDGNEQAAGAVPCGDPFSEELRCSILSSWQLQETNETQLFESTDKRPVLKADAVITVGDQQMKVLHHLASGAYARVYLAQVADSEETYLDDDESFQVPSQMKVVLKADNSSTSACWEAYICCELRQRLKETLGKAPRCVVDLQQACFFNNGAILVFPYGPHGTLLDLVGQYKKQYRSCVPECLVLYFALELITTLEQVHSCSIIHADVKPDNILVIDLPSKAGFLDDFAEQGPSCLQLIDFGRGIDMTKFPPGTKFTHVVTTDGFVCTEMRDNRPWTFQTDWFGLLGCLHVLLFGDYMDVEKLPNNTWGIRNKFKRYWQQDLWNGLFSTLLNIPSCSELPDLTPFKLEIQSLLRNKSRAHNVVLEALRAKNF